MRYVNLIYQSTLFIEAHLHESIKVQDVADHIRCSLFHFIRIFNQVVGHSPYDYIMRRRLSCALSDLKDTQKRILDIALDYQFNSHEAFSRAFKKMFRMTPSKYRNPDQDIPDCLLPALSLDYLIFLEKVGKSRVPNLLKCERKTISGFISPVEQRNHVKDKYISLFAESESRQNGGEFFGFSFRGNNLANSAEFYFIGQVCVPTKKIPLSHTIKQLPAGDYAKFLFDNETYQMQHFQSYLSHTWLSTSGYQNTSSLIIEILKNSSVCSQLALKSILIPIFSSHC